MRASLKFRVVKIVPSRARVRLNAKARNRILFDECECECEGEKRTCSVSRLDGRARHARDVLKLTVGSRVRAGVINVGRYIARVTVMNEREVEFTMETLEASARDAEVDVVLAMPRPKALTRLWAPLAQLGVGRIVIVNANKVERYYFDSSALDGEEVRREILRGLEQAGDARTPQVGVGLRLPPVIDRISGASTSDDTNGFEWLLEGDRGWKTKADVLLIAHPGQGPTSVADALDGATGKRVCLAIGPEGGWTDYELALFENAGFKRVGLGSRTFTTDVACISLVSAVRERLQSWQ